MSPRPQHTGRPGSRVIPTDWHVAPAAVLATTRRGVVSLRHAGFTQEWSDAEEAMVSVPLAPYAADVSARVQALTGQGQRVVVAEDPELVVDYLVVVDAAVDAVVEGDLVTVTSSGDAALDGVDLRVARVARGTERFERDLFCTFTT